MYCRNCGREISDIADVCINCGVRNGKGIKYCPKCGIEINEDANFCKGCGANFNNLKISNGYKSKVAAGVLGIILGGIGAHRFYLGYIWIGVLQIILTFFTCGFAAIWGFIEGILILCNSGITTDADGNPLI